MRRRSQRTPVVRTREIKIEWKEDSVRALSKEYRTNTCVWKWQHNLKYWNLYFLEKISSPTQCLLQTTGISRYSYKRKKRKRLNQSPHSKFFHQKWCNMSARYLPPSASPEKPIQINTSVFKDFPSFILGSCFLTLAWCSERIVLTFSANVPWASSYYKWHLNFKVSVCICVYLYMARGRDARGPNSWHTVGV